MAFLENAWYVAALSTEIEGQALFHRKLLNQTVLIYRKESGEPVAMQDRCPHRFVPLHMGKRIGDDVVCPYHALRFDCSGKCVHNPHGNGHIPGAAKVRSFPLVERHGFIWIWMGQEPADITQLPDFSYLDQGHENAIGYTYMHLKAGYELIIDNVMDLSHVDHVHGDIISTRGQLSPLIPRVRESERSVAVRWDWEQTPPMLIFADFLPEPQGAARHFVEVTWTPPGNIQLSVGGTQDKDTRDAPLGLQNTIGQYDLHCTTPETEGTTHYFFVTRRNHLVEDAAYNKMKIEAMHGAFENEDGPIIEAVAKEMGNEEFFSMKPVLMTNDVAPVKFRKLLKKLIDAEQHPSRAVP